MTEAQAAEMILQLVNVVEGLRLIAGYVFGSALLLTFVITWKA